VRDSTPRIWEVCGDRIRDVTFDSRIVTLGVARAAARSFWMKRPWWKERPSGVGVELGVEPVCGEERTEE
jgi:hypothetical protein